MREIHRLNRIRLRRFYTAFWRFHTGEIAQRMAQDATPGLVLSRRYNRYALYLDLSRSNTHRRLYLEGRRFVIESDLVASLLKPNMTVVDVGANIGYFMLMLCEGTGENGRVLCFEPDNENLLELKRNIERNGLRNVQVVEAAVGPYNGTVELSPGMNAHIGPGDDEATDEANKAKRVVPMVSLDTAIKVPIDFLKIDVEGYEGHVLAGAVQTIEKYRPLIFLEMHPYFLNDYSQQEIIDLLKRYYSTIEIYVTTERSNAFSKVKYRYLGHSVLSKISPDDISDNIRDYVTEGVTYTIVCKP